MTRPPDSFDHDGVPTRGLLSRAAAALRRRFGRVTLVVFGALALVFGAGVGTAYAYFTSTGSGTGTGVVDTMHTVVVVTASATPSTSLLPGTTGDVTLTVHNPNPHAVKITTVVGDGTVTASGAEGTCATPHVTFTNQTGLTGDTVGPSATKSFHFAGAASMGTTSPSGCQGATFSIPVTVTAHT